MRWMASDRKSPPWPEPRCRLRQWRRALQGWKCSLDFDFRNLVFSEPNYNSVTRSWKFVWEQARRVASMFRILKDRPNDILNPPTPEVRNTLVSARSPSCGGYGRSESHGLHEWRDWVPRIVCQLSPSDISPYCWFTGQSGYNDSHSYFNPILASSVQPVVVLLNQCLTLSDKLIRCENIALLSLVWKRNPYDGDHDISVDILSFQLEPASVCLRLSNPCWKSRGTDRNILWRWGLRWCLKVDRSIIRPRQSE